MAIRQVGATTVPIELIAAVGERARADARIILQGVRTEVFRQRTKESRTTSSGKGNSTKAAAPKP